MFVFILNALHNITTLSIQHLNYSTNHFSTISQDFFGEASPLAVMIDENYSKFGLQPRTLSSEQKSSSSLDLELRVKLEDLYSCSTICKKIDRQRFDQNNSS